MALRITIIVSNELGTAYFTPTKFKETLKRYFEKHKDIEVALSEVEKDIKESFKRKFLSKVGKNKLNKQNG